MYKVHHDALMLPVHVESESLSSVPVVTASASEDDNRKIHVSLTNIDLKYEQTVQLDIRGVSPKYSGGTIITSGNMCDHNTFDEAEKVKMREFTGAVSTENGRIKLNLPPKSVVTLELA
jgi:alpha-N-arabinofuranosidase